MSDPLNLGTGAYVLIAVLSTSLSAVSMLIDKVLVDDVIDDHGTLMVTSKFTTFLLASIVGMLFPVTLVPAIGMLGLFAAHSLLKTGPLLVYFRAVERGDTTLISPILGSQSVITVILGVLVLNESLSLTEIFGVILVIGGVLALTLQESSGGKAVNNPSVLAIVAMVLWAIEAVFLKYILTLTNFSTTFFWSSLGSALFVSLFLTRSRVRRELSMLAKWPKKTDMWFLGLSEVVSSFSALTGFVAYTYGPVSIVNPLMNVRPVVVFLFVAGLTAAGVQIDSANTNREWKLKFAAALTTVLGVILLT